MKVSLPFYIAHVAYETVISTKVLLQVSMNRDTSDGVLKHRESGLDDLCQRASSIPDSYLLHLKLSWIVPQ